MAHTKIIKVCEGKCVTNKHYNKEQDVVYIRWADKHKREGRTSPM